jgi:transcriptional regulator with XRE-family HTH domain
VRSRRTSRPHPVKGYLTLAGITNRALAERAQLSAIWVGMILNGHARPPEQLVRVVCELLGRPEEVLFNRPEDGWFPAFEPIEAAS